MIFFFFLLIYILMLEAMCEIWLTKLFLLLTLPMIYTPLDEASSGMAAS